jgi:hypothetical protein
LRWRAQTGEQCRIATAQPGPRKVRCIRVWCGGPGLKPKIPIFDTVGHGFYFGLTRYLSILKVTWLPAVLAGCVLLFELSAQLHAEHPPTHSKGHLADYLGLVGSLPLYALLAVPAVAAYRMAVFGRRPPGGPSHFRFGGTELQFVASQLVTAVYMMIYVLLALVIVVPAALAAYYMFVPSDVGALASIARAVSSFAPTDALTWRMRVGSGAVVVFLLLSAFGTILFSLVQPVVVAEHRIGVWRSLRLLWFGNAIRLAIVWAIVGITFLFFTTVMVGALNTFGPRLLALAMPHFDQKNVNHLLAGWTILIFIPTLLLGALALGVTAGVNGFAYRKLALQTKREPSR